MERLLISACLIGAKCKYSGGHNALPENALAALRKRYALVPVCPETAGGLGVPREPSERRDDAVISRSGRDVTAAYCRGAAIAGELCERFGCRTALLKERSPSCGSGAVYDGSFSGTLVPGDGVTAELLKGRGVLVVGEGELEKLLGLETVKKPPKKRSQKSPRGLF